MLNLNLGPNYISSIGLRLTNEIMDYDNTLVLFVIVQCHIFYSLYSDTEMPQNFFGNSRRNSRGKSRMKKKKFLEKKNFDFLCLCKIFEKIVKKKKKKIK